MQRIEQISPCYGREEEKALRSYLRSGGWLTEFRKTREFEKMICDYTGATYCSALNNGTVSLFVALKALDIGRGDEVIVPDYTMIATANAVVLAGARPVFVDIRPDSLCMDARLAKKAMTRKTRAVIHVSINGRPGEIVRIRNLCRERKINLVEDAAQSMGSFHRGKHLGTFGLLGSFSFSMPKIITTGQGGALITGNKNIYRRITGLKDFGREKSGIDRYKSMGWNFKFTDLQAVIGIEQMKKIKLLAEKKKTIYRLYKRHLENVKNVRFIPTDLKETVPWFVDILVPRPKKLKRYLKKKGIESRCFYPPIHSQPPYRLPGKYPVTENVSCHGLWLPSSPVLRAEEIDRICGEIKKFKYEKKPD